MTSNERQIDIRRQRFLSYPLQTGGRGTLLKKAAEDHLRDLILQVLLTNPGERVNLPEFGAGVERLVFAPNSDMLRASAQFLIWNNLEQWLGDRMVVEQVTVDSQAGFEETVTIEVVYALKATGQRASLQVEI